MRRRGLACTYTTTHARMYMYKYIWKTKHRTIEQVERKKCSKNTKVCHTYGIASDEDTESDDVMDSIDNRTKSGAEKKL